MARIRQAAPPPFAQRGFALMVLLALLIAGGLYFVVGQLDTAAVKRRQDKATAQVLAQAKAALIGDAISQPVESAGYLRLPDLGFGNVGYTEGTAGSNFIGNLQDYSVLGKLPWLTLGLPPPYDGQGQCLWYMVSGRFKAVPTTAALNWDTLGQIDVVDGAGNPIATNLVALVVSPGPPVDGQDRSLADPSYTQCGGNYDARNYLDPYNLADAVGGQANYLAGSNNRVASGTGNKGVVVTVNDHYNDRVLFISADELFSGIVRRSDFAVQVSSLLDDPSFQLHLQSVPLSAGKGTDNVDCNNTSSASTKAFCNNWLEMLLLKQLNTPGPITIDGTPTPNCTRVLFFGGERAGAQVRTTDPDKADPANYLEGTNAAGFVDPLASSASFVGTGTFAAANPSADLLRCLP